MSKEDFIKNYVIAYVSLKMYGINRNEVQNADLPERYTKTALIEAQQIWETIENIKS